MKVSSPEKNWSECEPVNISNNIKFDFVKIEKIFEEIDFSLSTPAIKSKLDDYWISIGHIKLSNSKQYNFPCIQNFINFIKEGCSSHHPLFYYACFFYKFIKTNINSYKIIGVSKLFLFYPCNYSVIFPCGLDYLGKDIIISYGDGDRYCKLIIVDESSIDWIDSVKTSEDWKLMLIK